MSAHGIVPGTLGGALREGHGVRWTGCTELDARDGMRWAVGGAAERRVRLDRGMACAEQDARDGVRGINACRA